MTQLAHGASFNLSDALTREVEVFADLFERARLAPVETEAQLENFTLALIERSEQASDLLGEQCGRGDFER